MALQSQAPRAGVNRRYTTTSRRKTGLAPWLVLIGVAVIIGGLIFLFGGATLIYALFTGEDQPIAADDTKPADGSTSATDATSNAAAAGTNGQTPVRPRDTGSSNTQNTRTTQTPPPPFAIDNLESRPLVGQAKDQYETGMQRLEAGDLVTGRALLSELLFREGALPRHEAQAVRERLTHLNEQFVFNRAKRTAEQIATDPIVELYRVQSGDNLIKIANVYRIPYQLIERINGFKANKLQADVDIQVIKGPVHARIDKSDYRMDLYVVDNAGLPIYLKSYTVGLGEFDSTPIGQYRIKPGSKVGPENGGPSWRNPRTGKVYDRNDPDIPIGEYWMALEGTDENTKGKEGYGIHATNDPESIGQQLSMGCIRMRDEDVDQVFYTLFEGESTVEIVP